MEYILYCDILKWRIFVENYQFIHENKFETVVCEMAVILSRPQYVRIMACHFLTE